MAYLNGRIPDSALSPIPGGGRLLTAVAVVWSQICAEVKHQYGWTPEPTGPLDAYRPISGSNYAQIETFLRRYQTTYTEYAPGKVDRRVWNGFAYWRLPGQAAAAVPGTSNHGWACAVDVTGLGGFDGVRYQQFAKVAARFGWTNTEGRSINEPWHWVDVGNAHLVANGLSQVGVVVNLTAPTLTPPTPLVPEEDDDMAIIYEVPGRGLWLDTGAGELSGIATTGAADGLTAKGVKRVPLPVDDWARLRAARAGRELIVAPTYGVAVGTPGQRYRGVGSAAEVKFHENAGCLKRTVDDETYRNLTVA